MIRPDLFSAVPASFRSKFWNHDGLEIQWQYTLIHHHPHHYRGRLYLPSVSRRDEHLLGFHGRYKSLPMRWGRDHNVRFSSDLECTCRRYPPLCVFRRKNTDRYLWLKTTNPRLISSMSYDRKGMIYSTRYRRLRHAVSDVTAAPPRWPGYTWSCHN